MGRVVHLTSVHIRYDTRIFLKECRSLARAGYEVTLVVADGKGDEVRDAVRIVDVGRSSSRFRRMLAATRRMLARAREIDADIYHLHDPELIPAGLALRRAGKRVVFDAHEDVPKQVLGKPYLRPWVRRVLARGLSIYERRSCAQLSGIIAATPFIRDKFLAFNPNTVDVNNYPMRDELEAARGNWANKGPYVTYIGSIARSRGIHEAVRALEHLETDTRLLLAGPFCEEETSAVVRKLNGWSRVDELGFVDRAGVKSVLSQARAGLVTLHPTVNYMESLPVKMFEYMAAGVPVIASDFPLWRGIIDNCKCGLCVDPLDPREIARAIDHIVTHPAEAEQMGRNGEKAVRERYNWSVEEQKLLAMYRQLLEPGADGPG